MNLMTGCFDTMKTLLIHTPFSMLSLLFIIWGFSRSDKRLQDKPVYHSTSSPIPTDYPTSPKPKNSPFIYKNPRTAFGSILPISHQESWGAFLLGVIVLLFGLWMRTRKRYVSLQAQLHAFENRQLNPHFVSNSLNAIEGLINLNKRKEASQYLIRFSRLSTYMLTGWQKSTTSLFKELQNLDHFLALEQLRFKDKLGYEIVVAPELDTRSLEVPFLLLQPHVEQAIWLGIKPKEHPGKVKISVSKQDNSLLCQVEDNGLGREKSLELHDNSTLKEKSVEIEMSDRVNKPLHATNGISCSIIDLTDENGESAGTRVAIQLPLRYIKPSATKSNVNHPKNPTHKRSRDSLGRRPDS